MAENVISFLGNLIGKLFNFMFNFYITPNISLGTILLIFAIIGIVLNFTFGILNNK